MSQNSTIDDSIRILGIQIEEHRTAAFRVLSIFVMFLLVIVVIFIFPTRLFLEASRVPAQVPYIFAAIFVVVFVVVFGVLMSIYRFHLIEISKAEHNRLGFMRIRVAANNADKDGFQSEVREALTQNAFEYSTGKDKKVESPLPGHLTSDISTALINKLMSNIDVKLKKDAKQT